MADDIQIYVDNVDGRDTNRGKNNAPVRTADRAFNLLPDTWRGGAEIIFVPTGEPYDITTSAVSFGTPIGTEASPLVIRGDYRDLVTVTAVKASDGNRVLVTADDDEDGLIGAVFTRLSGTGTPIGTAVLIRGNSPGPNIEISLSQTIGVVAEGDTFKVQRPAVTLRPTRTLHLTSHDGRSPNFTMIGIKFAPAPGMAVHLLNIRAHCDTCEFAFQAARNSIVHTNARIQGGIEDPQLSPSIPPERGAAGVYIHSTASTELFSVTRGGILAGHLVFKDVNVRVSQGGVFIPRTLEALRAPIHILTGGSALGQPASRTGPFSWGIANNKARIRNVPGVEGDGIRVFNGGTLNSPAGPIHLDIFGCGRDGIRLDMGSTASFGMPGAEAGLVTTGAPNGGYGMNVRNASRALVGTDAATTDPLRGTSGEVTIDDDLARHLWSDVVTAPLSNAGMSLVRVNM